MKLAALLLIPVIGLAGCSADYSNDEVARTVVAAGAGYALGKYVEKNANDDRDDRRRDHRRDYVRECRGDRFDSERCYPRHRYDDRYGYGRYR